MEYRILGPLEVFERGRPITLGEARQRALLALLLIHANEVVATERLIDDLWRGHPSESAQRTLQVDVSRLRKLLPPDTLATRTRGYLLRVEPGERDVDHFEELVAAAREALADGEHASAAETLSEALALIRGRPLEDLESEPFARAEAARLDELRVAAQELERAIVDQDPSLARPHAHQQQPIQPQPPATAMPAAQAREERKTVTALFCDIADSTALGERLDPEALRRVLSRYFEETRAVLERHGGTIEKYMGDAVLAVFGVPVAHEDDAHRAARAATEVRDQLALLNEELERTLGVTIATRIGVNTGEVIVTGSESDAPIVTGDVVNVAAGLEQAAAPGDILLGPKTYLLVRDAVSAEAVEPLVLKRRKGTVRAHRLIAAEAGRTSPARRLDSPLVGRRLELARLRQAFDQAAADHSCQLFTVLGAAGVGKSRLAAEFIAGVNGDATVLRGRCLPYGEGITFWPLAEALKQLGGDDVSQTAEALLAGSPHAALVAQRLAQFLGLEEDAAGSADTFWAVRTLFEAAARSGPLVLVFDDLHWAEAMFLDLVEHIADWSRDVPIVILCLARPELLDTRSGWAGGTLNATTVLLEPLSEAESSLLLANLLGGAELPEPVMRRISQAAEGNPLFLEEMLGMLIDEGVLRHDNGSWVAAEDARAVRVPPTIQALLAARLDLLPEDERAVIEVASIEGKEFHVAAVAELAPEQPRDEIDACLLSLLRKELIRPARGSFPGHDAFRFRHILIRDAAYDGMSKERRSEHHEHHADWLERVAGERVAEYEEIVGSHLEQAYRYRTELGLVGESTEALAERAGERLASAGRAAFAHTDLPAAANLLARAWSLLPPTSHRRVELLPSLATALQQTGRLDAAKLTVAEAEEAAKASGDRRERAVAQLAQLRLRVVMQPDGSNDAIENAATSRLLPVFEELGDEAGLALTWRLLGDVHLVRGRTAEAESAWRRALEHARSAGKREMETVIATWLLVAVSLGPTPVPEAIRFCREIVDQPGAARLTTGAALAELGLLQAMEGDFAGARSRLAHAQAVADDLGHIFLGLTSRERAGVTELLAEQPEAAEREFRAAYEYLERLGEQSYLSTQAARLSRAVYEQGRLDEAEHLTRVSEEAASSDDLLTQLEWRAIRAKVLAQRGRLDDAEALAREAAGVAARTDFLVSHGDVLLDLAEVLRRSERLEDAAGAVEQAQTLYLQKGNVVSARKARKLLGTLRTEGAEGGRRRRSRARTR